jgi:bacteriorhodopsin
LSYALVNLTFFYPLDALARGWVMPASLVWLKILYFACYTAAVLALGVAMFQRRQIAQSQTSSSMPPAVSLLAGGGRIVAIIAVIFAGILLTQRGTYNWPGLLRVAAMVVASGVCWTICSALGGGRKWAFWTAGLVSGLVLVSGLIMQFAPAWSDTTRAIKSSQTTLMATIISAAVMVVLILPTTRKHFR